jgi:TolB protein
MNLLRAFVFRVLTTLLHLRFSAVPSILALLAASCSREAPIPEKSAPEQVSRPSAIVEKPAASPGAKPRAESPAAPSVSASAEKPKPPIEKFQEIPPAERDKLAGLISFISERDGQREVYIVQANGTKEKRFTDNKYADYNGPFSPDGKALLVTRVEGEDGPHKLYFWPLDGTEPRRLGPDTMRLRFPNFTPDGKFIVFESSGSKELPSHFCDIYRIDSGGKKFERMTKNDEGNFEPSISPRGDVIVHISSRDRVAELYAMKVDGQSPLRLTNTPRDEWGARFSPDGTRIAFISDREGAERIWIKDFPDGPEHRLTQRSPASRIVEDKITWAPSGKKIAYVLTIPETPSVVVIFDIDSGKEIFLRGPSGQISDPSWSPDGRYMAVTVTHKNEQQIWIVRENGSAWTKLTNSSGGNWNPIWGPVKTKK